MYMYIVYHYVVVIIIIIIVTLVVIVVTIIVDVVNAMNVKTLNTQIDMYITIIVVVSDTDDPLLASIAFITWKWMYNVWK